MMRRHCDLSPSELRLVGRWTFSTCDSMNLPRVFEFRDDRIAVIVDAGPSPATVPSFYDWRIEGEELVLTRYEEREFGESTVRKVRRASNSLGDRLKAKPARAEPVETYAITHKVSDTVELAASLGCTITLSSALTGRRTLRPTAKPFRVASSPLPSNVSFRR